MILLLNYESRNLLKNVLLQQYFPLSSLQNTNVYYLDSIVEDILNEFGAIYRKKLEKISKSMAEETYEEAFLRGSMFKHYSL